MYISYAYKDHPGPEISGILHFPLHSKWMKVEEKLEVGNKSKLIGVMLFQTHLLDSQRLLSSKLSLTIACM